MRPLVSQRGWDSPRTAIPIECEIGNAVVSQNFKYLKCHAGARAEQFYDRIRDPYETRNAASDPGLQPSLAEHRRLLAQHHPV